MIICIRGSIPKLLRGLQAQSRNVLAGNPDLQPERTISWELGLKREINENTVASITYFNKQFRNQIDAKTLIPFDSKSAGDYGFASYVNNAQASAYGLEFVLTRQNDPRLSGSISYSYMVTEGLTDYANQGIQYAQWGFPIPCRSVSVELGSETYHQSRCRVPDSWRDPKRLGRALQQPATVHVFPDPGWVHANRFRRKPLFRTTDECMMS